MLAQPTPSRSRTSQPRYLLGFQTQITESHHKTSGRICLKLQGQRLDVYTQVTPEWHLVNLSISRIIPPGGPISSQKHHRLVRIMSYHFRPLRRYFHSQHLYCVFPWRGTRTRPTRIMSKRPYDTATNAQGCRSSRPQDEARPPPDTCIKADRGGRRCIPGPHRSFLLLETLNTNFFQ